MNFFKFLILLNQHWFNLDIVNKDFEDIDGNWVEAKKGKKKKKKQAARFRTWGVTMPRTEKAVSSMIGLIMEPCLF